MTENEYLNYILHKESRGRRYDRDGNLLTSSAGARGEMQVMPFTSRDPGFGVTPARDNSPEELARVGKDYALAMRNRYGDDRLGMMAYNWGPGAVDKWLASGADPSLVPLETRKYVQGVGGGSSGFIPASAKKGAAETQPVEDKDWTVELLSGRKYNVRAPTPEAAWDYASMYEEDILAQKAKRPGFFQSLAEGVKSATVDPVKAARLTADANNPELEKELLGEQTPKFTSEDFMNEFKAGRYGSGLGELLGYAKQTAGESIGAMVPGGMLGRAAAAATPVPMLKPVAGALGTLAGFAAQQYASDVQRQAAERELARQKGQAAPEFDFGKAGMASIGQAGLDMVTLRAAGLQKMFGFGREQALNEARRQLAKEGLLTSVGRGTLQTAAAEVPTEVAQQGLERWQAGLPITGEDAMKEYKEAAIGAGVLSPVFGIAGRRAEVSGARTQIAQEEQAAKAKELEERRAAEQERNARIEGSAATRVAAQNEDLLAGREAAVSSAADEFISKLDSVEGINELLQNPRQWLRDDVSKEDVNKFRNDLKQMREALKEKQKREAELSSQSAFNQPVETTTPPPATDTALAQGASEAVASKLDEFNEKAKTVEGVNDLLKNLKSWFPTANRDELTGFKSTLEKMRSDLQATQAADAKKAKQSAFAAAEVDEQGNVVVPSETQITPEKLKSWGVNRGSNLYKALLGKDIANPEDFAFARSALEAAASTTKAAGFASKLEGVLNTELAPKEEKAPVQEQAGMQTEEQAAPAQSTEVVDEAALEEQRAQEEHNKLRFLDMQNRLRTPAEREQMAAEERARREEGFAAAEEEKRRQEEAMFAQQEQEAADYAEKGTQFPLHSFGAQPQTQENVAPELDQLLTEYLNARDRVNSDPNAEYEMQDIEALARETYGGRRWASAKYEAVKRRQGQLDFEGKQRAEEEPRGEAAVGGQERGVGRESGEPSVGLATQPQEQPAAEVAQAPAARGVGPTERVPAQRDEGKKREQRALEVDPVQLVSDLQEISQREGNSEIGKRARTYLREAQQGKAKDAAPAAAFAEEHKAPTKETPKVEKTANELEADLADALAEGNDKRAAAIEAKLSKIGKKPIAKEEVEAAAEAADETRTRKYSGDKEAFEGSTVERLMAAVKQLFNNPTQLNRKLSIVQSVNDLPADIRADFEASEKKGVIQRAVYDGETDRVYLVADRIPANMVLGIILHENGVHQSMRTLLGPQLHSQLISQINQWAETGAGIEGEIARKAKARVEAAENANAQDSDEILAYFTEIANQEYGIDPTAIKGSTPLANWFRKLWAAVKSAVRKMGINPEKMTAQDVIDLAYGAARLEFNGAWHGTAADFRRFDHSYMGTGEGAQAYGWGTYLAQRPGIAKGYWEADIKRKTKSDVVMFQGERVTDNNELDLVKTFRDDLDRYDGRLDALRAEYEGMVARTKNGSKTNELYTDLLATLEVYESGDLKIVNMKPEGSMMRVDANVRDDEMLDWHASFSEQSQRVQDALRGNIGMDGNPDITYEGSKGSTIYDQLESALGSDKAASEYLDSIGIKGIQFFDAASRSTSPSVIINGTPIEYSYDLGTNNATLAEKVAAEIYRRNGDVAKVIAAMDERLATAADNPRKESLAQEWAKIRGDIKYEFPADKTRNLVIFNDKNLHRTFSQPGARRHERKFSGAPLVGDDILNSMGRTMPEADNRGYFERAKDAVLGGMPKTTQGKTMLQTAIHGLENILDAGAELNRELSKALRQQLPETDANDKLVQLAMSQADHYDGVAEVGLRDGGLKYDDATHKVVSEKSEFTLKAISDQYRSMMKQYGYTLPQARYVTSVALESKRMLALMDKKQQMLADANTLERNGKKKEAAKLRKQADDYVFHMTREQAQTGMKLFNAVPEIVEIERIKNGMRSWVGQFMKDMGLWSDEYAGWMLENAEWIPFNREFEEDESNLSGFNGAVNGLQASAKKHKFHGSMREVHDVMDNFENWMQYSIKKAVANHKARELAQAAMQYLPDDMVKEVYRVGTGRANHTVNYIDNGTQKHIEFSNPALAQAFKGQEAYGKSMMPVIGGFLNSLNRTFRSAVLNFPLFAPLQLVMDAQTAVLVSGLEPKYAVKILSKSVSEAVKTMAGTSKAHERLKQFAAVGVMDYNASMAKLDAEVNAGLKDLGTWGRYKRLMQNNAMVADNAVRQAVYLATLESGRSEAEAVQKAFEVINFRTRVGSKWAASAARNVVFLNAFYAATRASLKVLAGEGISPAERTKARSIFLQNAAAMAALTLGYAMMNAGDEGYEKLSPEERAFKWVIPGTGGWGVPMRVDVFGLIKYAAESLVRQTGESADDTTQFMKATGNIVKSAVLSGPMPVPQPIMVAEELRTNYNSFTGRPIVGAGLQKREAFKQYSNSTSELAKYLGEGAKNLSEAAGMQSEGLSPVKIDHLIRGLGGMWGGFTLLATNALLAQAQGKEPATQSLNDQMASIPGLGRVGAKDFDSADKDLFYDFNNRVNAAVETANSFKAAGQGDEYRDYVEKHRDMMAYDKTLNTIEKQLSKIRKAITITMERKDMTSAEKGEEVTRLREIEKQYLKNVDIRRLRLQAGL